MSEPRHCVTTSVIVVNFNGGAALIKCLDSIQRSIVAGRASAEIILVDNASDDGSRDIAASFAGPNHATLILNDQNEGYAAAVRQAANQARGEYLAVCNMDIVVRDGWLDPLVGWLSAHPETGAVSPLLLLPNGQVNACGQDIHITGLGFNSRLGCSPERISRDPIAMSGIHGAAFVIRRDVFESVGGIDSSGFLYHEDVNLSWMLRLAGYDLYCIPSATVIHDYFLTMDSTKFHLLERNRVAMLGTYLRPQTLVCISPALAVTESMVWAYAALRGFGFLAAKWRSYVWAWHHRREIACRRRVVATLRRRSDWRVLRSLRWAYEWRQFASLLIERRPRRNLLQVPERE